MANRLTPTQPCKGVRTFGAAQSHTEASASNNEIPKMLVWRAYRKVKSKGGTAGVDGESLEAFERNLKGNLYRIWNRMSSGSYFPPPVKAVPIPKKSGGRAPRWRRRSFQDVVPPFEASLAAIVTSTAGGVCSESLRLPIASPRPSRK